MMYGQNIMFGIPSLPAVCMGILPVLLLIYIPASDARPLEEILRGFGPEKYDKTSTDSTSSDQTLSSDLPWTSPIISGSDGLLEAVLQTSSDSNSKSHINQSGGPPSQCRLPSGIAQVGERFGSNIDHNAFTSQLSPISSLLTPSPQQFSNSEESILGYCGQGLHDDSLGSQNSQAFGYDSQNFPREKQTFPRDGQAFQHDTQAFENERPVFQPDGQVFQKDGQVSYGHYQVLSGSGQVFDENGQIFHGARLVEHENSQALLQNDPALYGNSKSKLHGNGEVLRGYGQMLQPGDIPHLDNPSVRHKDPIFQHRGQSDNHHNSQLLQKEAENSSENTIWPLDGRGKRILIGPRYPVKRYKTLAKTFPVFPEVVPTSRKNKVGKLQHAIKNSHRHLEPAARRDFVSKVEKILSTREKHPRKPDVTLGFSHIDAEPKNKKLHSHLKPPMSKSFPDILSKHAQPTYSLPHTSFLSHPMGEEQPVLDTSQTIYQKSQRGNFGKTTQETSDINEYLIEGFKNSKLPYINSLQHLETPLENNLCTTNTGITDESLIQENIFTPGPQSIKAQDSNLSFEKRKMGENSSKLKWTPFIKDNPQLEQFKNQSLHPTIIDKLDQLGPRSRNQKRLSFSPVDQNEKFGASLLQKITKPDGLRCQRSTQDNLTDNFMCTPIGDQNLDVESTPFEIPVEPELEEVKRSLYEEVPMPDENGLEYGQGYEKHINPAENQELGNCPAWIDEKERLLKESCKKFAENFNNEQENISDLRVKSQIFENENPRPEFKFEKNQVKKLPFNISSDCSSSKSFSKLMTDEIKRICKNKSPHSLFQSSNTEKFEEKKTLEDIIPFDEVIKICAGKKLDIRKIHPVSYKKDIG